MMLPEHVKMLREHQDGLDYGRKPELDEQRYEEFNEMICVAMEGNRILKFMYYQRGKIKELAGHVHYVDEIKKELRVMDKMDTMHLLKVTNIVDIEYTY
jgi:YolD-like protein